jgi:hypothetical protein
MKAATEAAPSVRFAMVMSAAGQKITARGAMAYAEEAAGGKEMEMSVPAERDLRR